MVAVPRSLRLWGLTGAVVAAAFAIWMYFFPQIIPTHFAWNVQPRMAQVFIGAGYLFRTFFFLLFVFVPDYRHLRWAYVGNLAFTGALLLATLWHAESMHWRSIAGHLWIVFYTAEPVIMHYSIPRPATEPAPLSGGGPLLPWFRRLLILEVAVFGLLGLLLIINPAWTNTRWPWELNPFDARIVAAWWLGWAGWAGWMASAKDWEEVRLPAIAQVILLVALNVSNILFYQHFRATSPTLRTYVAGSVVLLIGLVFLVWLQERKRRALGGTRPGLAEGERLAPG
jgi:hypothetical protein